MYVHTVKYSLQTKVKCTNYIVETAVQNAQYNVQ
jgi:hypothetical protein